MKRLLLVCLLFVILAGLGVTLGYQSYAQSSEAESIESNDAINSTRTESINSTAIEFRNYKDEYFGLEIMYPSDWTVVTKNLKESLVLFSSPDNRVSLMLGTLPRVEDETLKEFGDRNFKNRENLVISEYYRNPNTTLAGLPAVKMVGSVHYEPPLFGVHTNYVMYNNCVLENRNLIFQTLYASREPTAFGEFRPLAEKMISSIKLIDKPPIFQEQD